MDKVELF